MTIIPIKNLKILDEEIEHPKRTQQNPSIVIPIEDPDRKVILDENGETPGMYTL